MRRIGTIDRLATLLFVAVCAAPALSQGKVQPPAPIPALIASASKVFLANAMDADYADVARTYNALYAGLKTWGKYQLVATPADADLVLEMHVGGGTAGTLTVRIIDRTTLTILWTINEPWIGAGFTETGKEKAASTGAELILGDLLVLSTPGATASPIRYVPPSSVSGPQHMP